MRFIAMVILIVVAMASIVYWGFAESKREPTVEVRIDTIGGTLRFSSVGVPRRIGDPATNSVVEFRTADGKDVIVIDSVGGRVKY